MNRAARRVVFLAVVALLVGSTGAIATGAQARAASPDDGAARVASVARVAPDRYAVVAASRIDRVDPLRLSLDSVAVAATDASVDVFAAHGAAPDLRTARVAPRLVSGPDLGRAPPSDTQ